MCAFDSIQRCEGRSRRLGRALIATAAIACASAGAADYVAIDGGAFVSVLPQGALADVAVPVEIAGFSLRKTPVTAGEFFRGQGVLRSENARLPTWLEWEYAAAADDHRRDARADPQWRRRILAWYERPSEARLPAVGGARNAYGVSDLHGVVWEWVEDFNALFIAGDSRTQGDPDTLKFCGAGAISIIDRDSYAVLMRIALLSSLGAADTTGSLGFRCARPLEEKLP